MTNEPSPRPWRVADYAQCPGLADIFDASGSPSGLVAGELKPADAALIVAAVNERDRLRDLVKRMADYAETYHALGVQGKSLVAEARAAIGEDAK